MGEFRARYSVADGYAGGSRPQYFRISTSDLAPGMERGELEEVFNDLMQFHFDQNIFPEGYDSSMEEFVEWATGEISAMSEEE